MKIKGHMLENGSLEEVKLDAVIPRVGRHVEPIVIVIDLLKSNGTSTAATTSSILLAKNELATMVVLDRHGVPFAPSGMTPYKPASMKRQCGSDDDILSNFALCGSAWPYEPTPRGKEIVLRTAEVSGASVIACDTMHSMHGTVITEVNISLGLNIEKVTGVNVGATIAGLALELAQKGGSSSV